jgi:uncharacterized protein YybS (DUF2232 family)
MKNINWKFVMFAAVILMLSGFAVSLYGLGAENYSTALVGLITVGTVCVSWWFWVMFVIRSMIANADRTIANVADIKAGIREVRSLIEQDIISNRQR